ncbi:MAG: hypothetical protein H6739_40550 [Alphaproteobacteria bacterium]|nr:hypothetical protein [Alphaproteobacteria bacterium]
MPDKPNNPLGPESEDTDEVEGQGTTPLQQAEAAQAAVEGRVNAAVQQAEAAQAAVEGKLNAAVQQAEAAQAAVEGKVNAAREQVEKVQAQAERLQSTVASVQSKWDGAQKIVIQIKDVFGAIANLGTSIAVVVSMILGLTTIETAEEQLKTSKSLSAAVESQQASSAEQAQLANLRLTKAVEEGLDALVQQVNRPTTLAQGGEIMNVEIHLQSLVTRPLRGQLIAWVSTSEAGDSDACLLTDCEGDDCTCHNRVVRNFETAGAMVKETYALPITIQQDPPPPCMSGFTLRTEVQIEDKKGRLEKIDERAFEYRRADLEAPCEAGATWQLDAPAPWEGSQASLGGRARPVAGEARRPSSGAEGTEEPTDAQDTGTAEEPVEEQPAAEQPVEEQPAAEEPPQE